MDIEKERAAFEKWAKEFVDTQASDFDLCEISGQYTNWATYFSFEAWQASATARDAEQRTVKVPEEAKLSDFQTGDDASDIAFMNGANWMRAEVLRMNGGE